MSWYNDVQTDRQWIRRVMREEKHLVERMNLQEVLEKHGIPADEAARVVASSKPASTVSSIKPEQAIETSSKSISKASRLTPASLRRVEDSKRMDADLESVSRVSVATPKTASSATVSLKQQKSIASRSQQSEIASSIYSSKSSQQRIQKLKKELEEEKRLRSTIEKELATIQSKDIKL